MNTPVNEVVPIGSLTPDALNVRTHPDENIEAIRASLERFGQQKPIAVWQGTVIAGNGTLRAAIENGLTEIWISRLPDSWTRETASAFAIADNRTAELAKWDDRALADTLLELQASIDDLGGTGFSDEDLRELVARLDESVPQFPSDEEQPHLDEKKPITCPECEYTWTPS